TSQSITREQGPARLAAHCDRLANECARQFGRPITRGDIERCKQQGFKQALINRPPAIDNLSNPLIDRGPGETSEWQICHDGCLWEASVLVKDPPGKSAVTEAQGPLFAAREINEGKLCFIRSIKAAFGPNCFDERECGMIARQQQV